MSKITWYQCNSAIANSFWACGVVSSLIVPILMRSIDYDEVKRTSFTSSNEWLACLHDTGSGIMPTLPVPIARLGVDRGHGRN